MWTVFPAAYAEITGVVRAGKPDRAVKLAVAEARDEIDAWINTTERSGNITPYPDA